MNLQKHKLIDETTLSLPIEIKEKSDKWSGVYVWGDNRDFVSAEHLAPIHAFRAHSKYNYPIHFFINGTKTGDLDILLGLYGNINVILIEPLTSSFEYNYWFINKLWHYIDSEYCLTFQNDGYLLKSGYEEYVENNDFDFIGAAWSDEVKLRTKYFDLPAQRVGNGGFSARKPAKMMEVLNLVNGAGGQEYIVEGQFNDGQMRLKHSRCAEDAFFSSFGFGMNIFKPVTVEEANKFSLEPIPFELIGGSDSPFGFHRCDY